MAATAPAGDEMRGLTILLLALRSFAQTAPAPISTVPLPSPPKVPAFTMLAAGASYDQLHGWRTALAGLLPISNVLYFSLTALVTTQHLNDPSTGIRVIAPSSDLWVEVYGAVYQGKKFSMWMGSGLRVNISSTGAVSSLSGAIGLNPPISTMARYAFSSKWAVLIGTRTTFMSPPNGSTAKGYWDFSPMCGVSYSLPHAAN